MIINAHNFPSTAFDPLSITGCLSWYDWSDASTIYNATTGGSLVAADGAVYRLQDKSSNARHLMQASTGFNPLRKTSIQNGLDCGLFDGTNDYLETSGNFPETGNLEVSVLVVLKKLTATKGHLFGWGTTGVALNVFGIYDDNSTIGVAYAGGNTFKTSAINTTTFHQLTLTKSAGAINTTSAARQDGVSIATSGHSTNTPNIAAALFYMGRWADFSAFFHGYIGEMLVYDSKLSDANRDAVEAYLKAKWGTP